jgi:hypothetical protein
MALLVGFLKIFSDFSCVISSGLTIFKYIEYPLVII